MREIVHLQAGQCGNQIGAKVSLLLFSVFLLFCFLFRFFDFAAFLLLLFGKRS